MAAINWKTGISGNWSQPSNWSSGTVPGGGDNVTINATGTYTVTIDGIEQPVSLLFNAPSATISVASGQLLNPGGATIAGGTIDGPGRLTTGGVTLIAPGQPVTIGGGLTWTIVS